MIRGFHPRERLFECNHCKYMFFFMFFCVSRTYQTGQIQQRWFKGAPGSASDHEDYSNSNFNSDSLLSMILVQQNFVAVKMALFVFPLFIALAMAHP